LRVSKQPADKSAHNAQPVDASMPYETAQDELEQLVRRIEAGEVGLEESIACYERGVALVKHCRALLDKAEQKFTDLTGQMAGEDKPSR
jgi:exodeoxyribonuclease VII small subunit